MQAATASRYSPLALLILTCIAGDHPINRINELLPWTWAKNR